jgi:hypothetical protein
MAAQEVETFVRAVLSSQSPAGKAGVESDETGSPEVEGDEGGELDGVSLEL